MEPGNEKHATGYDVLSENLRLNEDNLRNLGPEFEQLSDDIETKYFIFITKLQANPSFRQRHSFPAHIIEAARRKIVCLHVKVHGVPDGHKKFQLLCFPKPESCRKQETGRSSLLVTSFFKTMYNADEYINDPWSQRNITLMSHIKRYIDFHDHQEIFESEPVLRVLQLLGVYLDKWTVVNTIIINFCLFLYFEIPEQGYDGTGKWVDNVLHILSKAHVITATIKVLYYFSQEPCLLAIEAVRNWKPTLGLQRFRIDGLCKAWIFFSGLTGSTEGVYMLLYGIFSWLGSFIDPFLFAFHMLEFFFIVDISRLLLTVVIARLPQLSVTLLLGLVITYVYATLVSPFFALLTQMTCSLKTRGKQCFARRAGNW
eukprot:SAG11_NODE_34_length_22265_cov_11.264730_15_plen_371_part_00